MKILIDFDEVKQEIVSVTVNGVSKAPTVKKPKATKEEVAEIVLEDNKLIIPASVAKAQDWKTGDKLIVRYKQEGDFIEPFLGPPSVFAEEEGNKLTKGLTISFRGDQNVALAAFGKSFKTETLEDGSLKLIGDNKVKDKLPEITLEHLEPAVNIGDNLNIPKNSFEIQ